MRKRGRVLPFAGDGSAGREITVLRGMVAVVLLALTSAGDAKATKCTSQTSEMATVPQIAADPDKYVGRCVAIAGVMHGVYLFESVDGVYLQPRESLNPASSGFRLGLDNIKHHFSEQYRHVSILGRVQDCESVRDAAESAGVVMVMGYCHYFNGPYLWVYDVQYRSGRPFERRMGNYERTDYGNLVPAPEDWPHRAQVEALADEFLRALRASDRERLAGMHFRDVGLDWPDDEAALLRFLLKNSRSPFASIRTGRVQPERMILVGRDRLSPDPDAAADPDWVADYSATVCFCREPSCAGRWPIASFDADNVPARPYACTQVDRYLEGTSGRWVPHFTTQIGKGGLAEPRVH